MLDLEEGPCQPTLLASAVPLTAEVGVSTVVDYRYRVESVRHALPGACGEVRPKVRLTYCSSNRCIAIGPPTGDPCHRIAAVFGRRPLEVVRRRE